MRITLVILPKTPASTRHEYVSKRGKIWEVTFFPKTQNVEKSEDGYSTPPEACRGGLPGVVASGCATTGYGAAGTLHRQLCELVH